MSYSMEDSIEAERLENQIYQLNYRLSEELKDFDFQRDEMIMDAGCGTGTLTRYLAQNYNIRNISAVDGSELRIAQAKNLTPKMGHTNISFYVNDLCNLDSSFYNSFDTIICRYVLEHVEKPMNALKQLHQCLRSSGRIIVIDLDGVFLNLFTTHKRLNQHLSQLKRKINFDLFIGRKLPNYLSKSGFSNITWNAELLCCQGDRLLQEIENTEKRFVALEQFLTGLFGSHLRYKEFQNLYLSEMKKNENTLVFTKYICTGCK